MAQKKLKVGLVQQSCAGNRQQNLEKTAAQIHNAAKLGVQLILLPELHTGRYFCQTEDTANFDQAEAVPGPTTEQLATLAKELKIVIVGSVFERRAAGLYHNTAVVLDSDGSLAGCYRKMHIPDDPGYHEKFYFTPGDQGFRPIDTSIGKLGVLVCWDQWYPEAARLMALHGAELLLYPTAIGWDPNDEQDEKQRQLQSWQLIQRAHAIANGIPVMCCNRIGHETDESGHTAGINFWGNSFVCGPQGEILVAAESDTEKILVAELDKTRAETVRQIWPFLRDRRIDAYTDITKRYGK